MYSVRIIEQSLRPLFEGIRLPFTQTEMYGRWRTAYESPPLLTVFEKAGEVVGFAQWVRVFHPFGVSALYAPHGVVWKEAVESIEEVAKALRKFGEKESVSYIRIDVRGDIDTTVDLSQTSLQGVSPFLRFSYMQPRREQHLSLIGGYESVFAGMKKRTWRGIKASQRLGMDIQNGRECIFDCIECIEKTARRKGFNSHSRKYYESLFETLNDNELFMLCGYKEGVCVACGCFVVYNKETLFLLGGSDDIYGADASYGIQHIAIQEAIQRGCTVYNFGGVSFQDGDSLSGVSFFKNGFGGTVMDVADPYDVIVRPLKHKLYIILKHIQKIV